MVRILGVCRGGLRRVPCRVLSSGVVFYCVELCCVVLRNGVCCCDVLRVVGLCCVW